MRYLLPSGATVALDRMFRYNSAMNEPSSNSLLNTVVDLLNHFSITGSEGSMQPLLESRIRSQTAGAKSVVKITRFRQSLVVHVDPPTPHSKELILILGHTDTVPGDQLPARIDGDNIIGLGASDMKSGLALMLELLRAERLDVIKYPLAFVFYAGEEGPSEHNELGPLIAAFPELKAAAFGLFAEPTDRAIQVGCLGLINISVTFRGKAAHSARPWNGDNAIHKAGRFISAFEEMQPKKVRVGNVEYIEVASITVAKGGTASNVVPSSLELNLNVRIAPGTDPGKRVAELQALAGNDATFDVYDIAPAGRVPVNNAVYERFRKLVDVPEQPKQAYTDVGLLSELGIDAINFGPGLTGQCHVAGEYVKASDLEWCFEKYLQFLTT